MNKQNKQKSGFNSGIIFPGMLLLLGFMSGPALTFFASMAIKDVLDSPSLKHVNEQRALIRQWPHVRGVLKDVYLCAVTTHGKYSHDYCCVAVYYEYEKNGKKYIKKPVFRFRNGVFDLASFVSRDSLRRDDQGDDDLSYNTVAGGFHTAYENSRKRLSAFLQPEDKEQVETVGRDRILHKFHPNRPVDVYYSPTDPSVSTLDNKLDDLSWSQYFGSQLVGPVIGLFLGLLLCLADAVLVFLAFGSPRSHAKEQANLRQSGRTSSLEAHDQDSNIVPIKIEEQWLVEKPQKNAE